MGFLGVMLDYALPLFYFRSLGWIEELGKSFGAGLDIEECFPRIREKRKTEVCCYQ